MNDRTPIGGLYRPSSFGLQELVPPIIYNSRGESAWELLDERALMTLQALRDALGPITVNNWHSGGAFKESGLRSFDTSTGAKYSQHKFGRAFDCKFGKVTPREAADYILKHPERFPLLTTIENPDATPTWLHVDCRNHNRQGIWVVNP
ncbi:MAG: hypothetical protein ACREXP_00130 [Steroidobacteraceae bacterium]